MSGGYYFFNFFKVVFRLLPLPAQQTTKKKTAIPSAGFEPAISSIKRLKTYALDSTVIRIGKVYKSR